MQRQERQPGLDTLRAIASQAVVLGHTLNIWWADTFMSRTATGYEAGKGFYIQNLAVVVFFALSGFLIAQSAERLRGQPKAFSRFFRGRATRIFLPLVPVVVIVFALQVMIYGHGSSSAFLTYDLSVPSALLSATALIGQPILLGVATITGEQALASGAVGDMHHLWTIALEWSLYIAFGAAILGKRNIFLLVCLAAAALMPINHLLAGNALPLAWLTGVVCWRLRDVLARISIGIISSAALLAILVLDGNVYAPVAACVIAIATIVVGIRLPATPGSAFFARYSYSLYLVHLPVIFAIYYSLPDKIGAGFAIIAANIVGIAAWWAFERHTGQVSRWLEHHERTSSVVTCR